MADEAENDTMTQDDILGAIDVALGTKPAKAAKEEPEDVEGDDDEPESGESESDEQDEAESESDDEPEEAETDEDEETPKRVRLKVDGTDVEVTFDELKEGYSREADYRRKTQAHAEEVRKFEATKDETLKAERDALAAEREQYKPALEYIKQQITAALGTDEELARLRQENPGEWSAKMTERLQLQGQLQGIITKQAALAEQDKAKRETELRAKIAETAKKTLEVIPEWKNPEVYQADSKKIFEYGKSIGFTTDEMNEVAARDHRFTQMAKDAAAFRALQDKKPEAVKRVATAKPLPPGNAPQKQSQASGLKKLAESQARRGDRDSTAALLDALKLTG